MIEDENGLVGCGSSPRYIAAILDNFIGILLAVSLGSVASKSAEVLRGSLGLLGYFGYFFLLEGAFGRTVAKLLLGLVVMRTDGTRAGWREAAQRTLLRVLEVNPVLLGALPAALFVAFSKKHQRLGDMWAGTVVVQTT